MTAVDWSHYRRCPVCFAATGEPCTTRSGALVEGAGYVPDAVIQRRDEPHSRRELRKRYGR